VLEVDGAQAVEIWGTHNVDHGKVEVYLNGEFVELVDNYAPQFHNEIIYSIDGLPAGKNTLKLVNTAKSSGTNTWFVIDRFVVTYAEEQTGATITASNNSFVVSHNAALHETEEYYSIEDGEYVSVTVRGNKIALYANANLSVGAVAKIVVDGKEEKLATVGADGLCYVYENFILGYHTFDIYRYSGELTFSHLVTDDFEAKPLQTELWERAQENLRRTCDGTKLVSDPAMWKPVSYEIYAPKSGVAVTGGLLKTLFDKNVEYLNDGMNLQDCVDSPQAFWVDTLSASNEGRLLQGYANSLIWGGHNATYKQAVADILARIRARQLAQNGNALPYDEKFLTTHYDSDQGLGERKNYDRAMLTRGLIAAANYYEFLGYADAQNPAYLILRDFYDWFNYNENGYGLGMLAGQLGYQGHVASTLTYFSNVGKTEDLTYAELCYVQDWWLECLAKGTLEAIWKYPLDRTNSYMITGIDPYLDHYRATGNQKYLDAVLGFWRVYKENFIHENGAMAFCEHRNYEPKSFYLSGAKHTGELCGTVFWIDLNYKLLQLFPEEEKYAHEIERGLLNILPASQDSRGKVIYHQSANGYLNEGARVNACCEVMSVGLKARVASFVYQLAQDGVQVTLYNDSELNTVVSGKNYRLKTTGDLASTDRCRIENLGDAMTLTLRVPSWVAEGYEIKVNGEKVDTIEKGCYVKVSVNTGDIVSLYFPKTLQVRAYDGMEQVNGYQRYTLIYGPLNLAVCPKGAYSTVVYDREAILKTYYTIDQFAQTIDLANMTAGENGEFDLIPYGEVGRRYFALYPLFEKTVGVASSPELASPTGETVVFDYATGFDYNGAFVWYSNQVMSSAGAEAKAVAKNFTLKNNTALTVTIAPSSGGRIDGGLYVGVTGPMAAALDAITAYNINVEKAENSSYYEIKIHGFDYNEGKGKYLGCYGKIRIDEAVAEVKLSVLLRDGILYIYANNDKTPRMEFFLGVESGGVGLRSFMTAQRFSNMYAWECEANKCTSN